MREIKFRAWDEKKKEMLPPQDLSQGRVYWTWLGLKDVLLMQFTGLKDKNGKEIYEGDIVKGVMQWPYLFGDRQNYKVKMTGEVFYDLVSFSFKVVQNMSDKERDGMVNYFDYIGRDGETFDETEVIGNIYENPKLLK